MSNLVFGIGSYTEGKWPGFVNRRYTREYGIWRNMLDRCYSAKTHKRSPTYVGCTVDPSFHSFQEFMMWAEAQVGFHNTSYQLDKDILSNGCRIYSPSNCVFVPPKVNNFFNNKPTTNSNLPTGVSTLSVKGSGGKVYTYIRASITEGKRKTRHLGYFPDVESAFQAYKIAKEEAAKKLAHDVTGLVDDRVVSRLLNFTV